MQVPLCCVFFGGGGGGGRGGGGISSQLKIVRSRDREQGNCNDHLSNGGEGVYFWAKTPQLTAQVPQRRGRLGTSRKESANKAEEQQKT